MPATLLPPSPGRKQLQKPVFVFGRSRLQKAEDWRSNGIDRHWLAAEDSARPIVFGGRRSPMRSERRGHAIRIDPVREAIVKRRGTTGRKGLLCRNCRI